jgi:long-chain acyl-CoA synthetase
VTSVAQLLSGSVEGHPDRPALLFEGRSIAYRRLDQLAAGFAALLRARGVKAGDRVALMLPNAPAFVGAYYGALRAGAVVVPLNILLRPREVESRLRDAAPTVFVTDAERRTAVAQAVGAVGVPTVTVDATADDMGTDEPSTEATPRSADDPAVILYTSGTSGQSKGAVLTHGGLRSAATGVAAALALDPEDVVLGAPPLSHVFGMSTGMNATLAAGAAVLLVPRFEAAATLDLMARTGTTVFLGVPAMCISLCAAAQTAAALPPLRIAHAGGAAVAVETAREFEATFGCSVLEGYGLTEMSGIATLHSAGQPQKVGSVGTPLAHTSVRVLSLEREVLPSGEIGEIEFRGPTVTAGYWNDADATAAAIDTEGWLATGDLGRLDEDGYLFLVDRKKELILRGGYSVYPREIEEVLYEHPDVLEAAVVGIPHPLLGEEVIAVVVRRPGAALEAAALRDYARDRVAAYKYPRHIVFVADLPKGPTGKILKRAIDRDALARELEQPMKALDDG